MTDAAERALLAFSTAADEASAAGLARCLLEERLAACVNIVPGLRSMYWWQGRIEEGAECLLVIKTTAARWPALKDRLPQLHAYDVPELVATEITDGLEPYLRWLISEVQGVAR
ncbi:divalent-cation tolerance protein CutA [Schlegelella sp. S2-27]|uniref:Divalent-cation tolerance protein CutA n=1 Tax=Caldimonas mangrovi TaxID=2944811 RepID=A0ABT0YU22_9BURK|nr:divalent-cation tolerance protein CutA [Caldimonas mangrovi]MCM5682123.1 divalent-cation tolerance protein CutA [Caldimonas mangrovi]